MKCPRCDIPLQNGTYENKKAHLCSQCNGVLIWQRDLITILYRLSHDIANEISLDYEIDCVEDRGGNLNCPICRKAMDRHGYMGSNKVIIDTCSDCWAIWVDPLELGQMSLMHARTMRRAEHRRRLSEQTSVDIVTAHMVSKAIQRAFLLGYILG